MSESNKKFWYQDGWIIFWIVVVVPIVYLIYQDAKKPFADVEIAGRVDEPLFGTSRFEISVWHRTLRDLKNGQVTVLLQGAGAGSEEQYEFHNFETWAPNKDNAVNFLFPLENYNSADRLKVSIFVEAENIRFTGGSYVWQNRGWK